MSIPFIIVGLGLVAMIVPVLGDVDNDGKKDSVSKHLMYKFMASQEDSKAKVEATKSADEAGDSEAVAPMKQGFDKKKAENKRPESDDE